MSSTYVPPYSLTHARRDLCTSAEAASEADPVAASGADVPYVSVEELPGGHRQAPTGAKLHRCSW